MDKTVSFKLKHKKSTTFDNTRSIKPNKGLVNLTSVNRHPKKGATNLACSRLLPLVPLRLGGLLGDLLDGPRVRPPPAPGGIEIMELLDKKSNQEKCAVTQYTALAKS